MKKKNPLRYDDQKVSPKNVLIITAQTQQNNSRRGVIGSGAEKLTWRRILTHYSFRDCMVAHDQLKTNNKFPFQFFSNPNEVTEINDVQTLSVVWLLSGNGPVGNQNEQKY